MPRRSDCVAEVEHARVIARRGTSADHQLKVYHAALDGGASDHDAQAAVVDWLIEQSVTPDGACGAEAPDRRKCRSATGR